MTPAELEAALRVNAIARRPARVIVEPAAAGKPQFDLAGFDPDGTIVLRVDGEAHVSLYRGLVDLMRGQAILALGSELAVDSDPEWRAIEARDVFASGAGAAYSYPHSEALGRAAATLYSAANADVFYQTFTSLGAAAEVDAYIGRVLARVPAVPTSGGGDKVKGVDYAFARGSFFLNAVRLAGYSFAVRYLDGGRVPGKQLTAAERDAILAAGLGIFLVFETTGGAPDLGLPGGADYFTRDQGRADAQDAITAAQSLGYPIGSPIFYAVDQALADAEVVEYFNGTDDVHYVVPSDPLAYGPANVMRYESGAYADYAICQAAAAVPWRGVPWRWQTAAWSGGRRADGAQLYQYQNGVDVAGARCDLDELAPGIALPAWTTAVPPDPLWSRPDSSPWTVGDAREYARRLQAQLERDYVRKG